MNLKLCYSILDLEIHINNYSNFRLDRNRLGGGVAICIKNIILNSVRTDLNTDNLEMI